MKKLISLLLGFLLLISMAGIAQAADHTHADGCCTSGAAIVAVDTDGNEIFTIISESDDLDALHLQGRRLLAAGLDPTAIVSIEVDCCTPNPPVKAYRTYIHIPTVDPICTDYKVKCWICQLCGANIHQTSSDFVGEHIKNIALLYPH